MAIEIERKFLVDKKPENLDGYQQYRITQGYIDITDERSENLEMRIRMKGDKYFQTVKSGWGLERSEEEIELSKQQFNTLWPFTEGKRIEKIRYEIDYDNFLIELDIYSGSLEGLIVAEVEFQSVEESEAFNPPNWFDKEVTEDERFKNKNIAINGIPQD